MSSQDELNNMNSVKLPQEFDYTLPPSIKGCVQNEYRCQPINGSSWTSNPTYGGGLIQFDIACRPNTYLDIHTTYVRGRATIAYTGTGTFAQNDYARIIGSWYSLFLKQEVSANNVILESINEVGILSSMLLNVNLCDADKHGLVNYGFANTPNDNTVAYGASATLGQRLGTLNSTTKTDFATTTEGAIVDFAIPLIGILGCNSNKAFPLWSLYSLRLELTLDSTQNILFPVAATVPSGPNNGQYSLTLSDMEFVGNTITLPQSSQDMIQSISPIINFKTTSYKQSSNLLASASTGTNDLICGIRVNSLKSMYVQTYPAYTYTVSTGVPTGALEGKFASVNPNLDGFQLVNGSWMQPARPLNVSARPSDAFACLMKSFNALQASNYNSCISKQGYLVSSTAYGLCQAFTTRGFITGIGSLLTSHQCYLGVDTEICGTMSRGNLFNGTSIMSSPLFVRMIVGAALGVQHNINMFGLYDLVLQFDTNAKTCVAMA